MMYLLGFIGVIFLIGLIIGVGIETANGNVNSKNNKPPTKTVMGETTVSKSISTQTNTNAITCPNCQSINVDFIGNNKKGFSAGKAVGGAVLLGPIGAAAGFAGKKGKKNKWHCKECGNLFDK